MERRCDYKSYKMSFKKIKLSSLKNKHLMRPFELFITLMFLFGPNSYAQYKFGRKNNLMELTIMTNIGSQNINCKKLAHNMR